MQGGQAVYQSHGLMQYGSTLGHGSYLGPDFTAQALHITTTTMRDHYARTVYGVAYDDASPDQQAAVAARVITEVKNNRYDADAKRRRIEGPRLDTSARPRRADYSA